MSLITSKKAMDRIKFLYKNSNADSIVFYIHVPAQSDGSQQQLQYNSLPPCVQWRKLQLGAHAPLAQTLMQWGSVVHSNSKLVELHTRWNLTEWQRTGNRELCVCSKNNHLYIHKERMRERETERERHRERERERNRETERLEFPDQITSSETERDREKE